MAESTRASRGDAARPLFVPLAEGPFRRFLAGTKTVELRQFGPRWNDRHVRPGREVLLRLGYSTKKEALGVVGRVACATALLDLPTWALRGADVDPARVKALGYFDPEKDVIAFEVADLAWSPEAAQ